MDLELRKRIVKAMVCCFASCEMWIWRKVLKISWMQKVKNQEVLNTIYDEKSVINNIHQRKHKWIGHVLRHDGQLHTVMVGRIEGKRGRRCKRPQMIDDVVEKKKYDNISRTAEKRTRCICWRKQQMDLLKTCCYMADY